jgi:HSP20 family protein
MFNLVPLRNRKRGNLGRRDPFNNLVSDFFDDAFKMIDTNFKTDIKEKDDEYVIEAELPGLDRDDINLQISDDKQLIISATNEHEYEEEGEKYIKRERKSGKYQRSFYIENIEEDEIEANYENGILEVVLPKKEKTKPSSRTIDIQ